MDQSATSNGNALLATSNARAAELIQRIVRIPYIQDIFPPRIAGHQSSDSSPPEASEPLRGRFRPCLVEGFRLRWMRVDLSVWYQVDVRRASLQEAAFGLDCPGLSRERLFL